MADDAPRPSLDMPPLDTATPTSGAEDSEPLRRSDATCEEDTLTNGHQHSPLSPSVLNHDVGDGDAAAATAAVSSAASEKPKKKKSAKSKSGATVISKPSKAAAEDAAGGTGVTVRKRKTETVQAPSTAHGSESSAAAAAADAAEGVDLGKETTASGAPRSIKKKTSKKTAATVVLTTTIPSSSTSKSTTPVLTTAAQELGSTLTSSSAGSSSDWVSEFAATINFDSADTSSTTLMESAPTSALSEPTPTKATHGEDVIIKPQFRKRAMSNKVQPSPGLLSGSEDPSVKSSGVAKVSATSASVAPNGAEGGKSKTMGKRALGKNFDTASLGGSTEGDALRMSTKLKNLTLGRKSKTARSTSTMSQIGTESPNTDTILNLLSPKRHGREGSSMSNEDMALAIDAPASLTSAELSMLMPETSQTIMALLNPSKGNTESVPEGIEIINEDAKARPTSGTDDLEEDAIMLRPVKGRARTLSNNSRMSEADDADLRDVFRSSYCIPHRFIPVSALTAASLKYFAVGQSTCSNCQQPLKTAVVKCNECNLLAHRSCSLLLPPTCGIPTELMFAQKSDKKVLPAQSSFGISLELQCAREGTSIPMLVKACIRHIERRGLDLEGVYRVSGAGMAMDRLKMQFQYGRPNLDDPEWEDINIITGVLKQYYRSLPDPLLQVHLYDEFAAAVEEADEVHRSRRVQETLDKLHPAHLNTLAFTVRHLDRVQAHSELNRMNITNLALIFGPTLMRSNNLSRDIMDMGVQAKVLSYLITHARELFGAGLDHRDLSFTHNMNSVYESETAL